MRKAMLSILLVVCLICSTVFVQLPVFAADTNIALNKTASADSSYTGYGPAKGNDGSTSTLWCANDGNTGHWWKVDLGSSSSISGTEVTWELAIVYKYKVEVSVDNTNWTMAVDKTGNTSSAQTQTDNFTATARYVRITVTGLTGGNWASFSEFKVFGAAAPTPTPTPTPTPGSTELAQGKTATTDSFYPGNEASKGNDGSTSTLWCANDGNTGHWWKVDLGSSQNISSSQVTWEFAAIYKYKIEVSTDNTNWTLKVDKTANTSSAQTQTDNFTATARYVRITVTGLATGNWAGFSEFKVFGGTAPTPTPTPTPTPVPTPTPMPIGKWIANPWVTQTMKNNGFSGGEGGQVIQGIDISSDGLLLIAGTDVGGMYRSTDGGVKWIHVDDGYNAWGSSAVVIDPKNKNRVLSVACNSMPNPNNGIKLSTNAGTTWTTAFAANIAGDDDYRNGQITYDESSYNSSLGYCTVAYWSRSALPYALWGDPEIHPALYKSTDGGASWTEISNSSAYGEGLVKTHPVNGYVYVATPNGFFRSTNGGTSFTQIVSGAVTGLDVISGYPNNVYICKADGVYISTNSGTSFTKVNSSTFPSAPLALQVSPADPNYMLVDNHYQSDWWAYDEYYSHDGGVTWAKCGYSAANDFIQGVGTRANNFAWHPTDRNQVWSFGGDWVTKSTNGGSSFIWAMDGISAVMQGGKNNFSVDNPNVYLSTTQDFGCALTTDGGNSWRTVDFGYYNIYGGYAVNASTMIANAAKSGWDGERTILVTQNGGSSIIDTGIINTGFDTGYSVPGNSSVLFMGNYRSTNGGSTWTKMTNCDGVFTHNPTAVNELYGMTKSGKIVKSTDQGATWTVLNTSSLIPGGNTPDMAVDGNATTLWASNDNATGHWLKIDLGQSYSITRSELTWEFDGKAYQYKIDVSTDNASWTTAVDKTNNASTTQIQTDNFTATARYVRVTVTGFAADAWPAIGEWKIFNSADTNLALNKAAEADSYYSILQDLAFDHVANKMYIAAGSNMYTFTVSNSTLTDITASLPADQFGEKNFKAVVVDPSSPSKVYIGSHTGDTSVIRSTNSGSTWGVISPSTRQNTLGFANNGDIWGGYVYCLRINPSSKEIWIGTNCKGQWKIKF